MPGVFECRGCSLIANIEGGPHSSTYRGERTRGTPACPQCGTRSWIDPTSFTAYYAKLPSNAHTCVVGRHEDANVLHVRLDPIAPLPEPAHDVLVITAIEVGLCAEHFAAARDAGIGAYRMADSIE